MLGKNCADCVYYNVHTAHCISERDTNPLIRNCCILAAPLRTLQRKAKTPEDFAAVTKSYILHEKIKSDYWLKELKNAEV